MSYIQLGIIQECCFLLHLFGTSLYLSTPSCVLPFSFWFYIGLGLIRLIILKGDWEKNDVENKDCSITKWRHVIRNVLLHMSYYLWRYKMPFMTFQMKRNNFRLSMEWHFCFYLVSRASLKVDFSFYVLINQNTFLEAIDFLYQFLLTFTNVMIHTTLNHQRWNSIV